MKKMSVAVFFGLFFIVSAIGNAKEVDKNPIPIPSAENRYVSFDSKIQKGFNVKLDSLSSWKVSEVFLKMTSGKSIIFMTLELDTLVFGKLVKEANIAFSLLIQKLETLGWEIDENTIKNTYMTTNQNFEHRFIISANFTKKPSTAEKE